MTESNVAIVGIGNMGWAIAERLAECGYAPVVRDIDPDREALARGRGFAVAPSSAEAARNAAMLIVTVVDAAQTEAVLFGVGGDAGAAAALAASTCVLLCPTIAPADVEQFAARLVALEIGCLDAPMSGGPARARAGSMSLMVAGDHTLVDRCRSLLEAMASPVFRVSERVGDGARTKLVNNLLAAINLAGAAEALALAARVGLDPATTLAVIEQSSGQSWIGSERLRRALVGDLVPRAHMSLLAKDSRLAVEMARTVDADVALGAAAAARFAAACAAGLSSVDDAALYGWLGKAA
jgi:3-hydroxyisobutyrate dehydrogenase